MTGHDHDDWDHSFPPEPAPEVSAPDDLAPPLLSISRGRAELVILPPGGWTEYAPGTGPKRPTPSTPTHGELLERIDALLAENAALAEACAALAKHKGD